MKSCLVIRTLLVPLTFSVALRAADDSPAGSPLVQAYNEAVPSNGIVVSHTEKLTNPYMLPDLNYNPKTKKTNEVYTTFKVKEENNVAYCISPQKGNITAVNLNKKKEVLVSKEATGPFLVRSYDANKEKESSHALTADGTCEIEHHYKTGDSDKHLPLNTLDGITEIQLKNGKTAFSAGPSTRSWKWKKNGHTKKGRQKWISKILQEPVPFESPEDTSKKRMQQTSVQLSTDIDSNLTKISELEKEIAKLEEKNANHSVSLKHRLTGTLATMRQASNQKSHIYPAHIEKNKNVIETRKKDLLEKQKAQFTAAREKAKAITNARQNLESAIITAAKGLIDESQKRADEYAASQSYFTQYTSGLVNAPSVMSAEEALSNVLQDSKSLTTENRAQLQTKLLPAMKAVSKKEKAKSLDKLKTEFDRSRTEHQETHAGTLANWTEYQVEESNSLEELERGTQELEALLKEQNKKLEESTRFVATVLPALLSHYERNGLSEHESYQQIFSESTSAEKKDEAIDYFKKALAQQ